jgi:Protein of unknown function (DUF3365)
MGRYSLILLTLASTLLLAEPITLEQAVLKGSTVSAALVQKLTHQLKEQMQISGPIGALNYCTQNALPITDQIAEESNTSIKRVSLKNRNPINTASPIEKILLNRWEKIYLSGQPLPVYEIQLHGNGKYTYYKPIVINNEACLKCHGDIEADSPLYKAIRTAYPEDQATGYRMGDLRGMIVITLPKQN